MDQFQSIDSGKGLLKNNYGTADENVGDTFGMALKKKKKTLGDYSEPLSKQDDDE